MGLHAAAGRVCEPNLSRPAGLATLAAAAVAVAVADANDDSHDAPAADPDFGMLVGGAFLRLHGANTLLRVSKRARPETCIAGVAL